MINTVIFAVSGVLIAATSPALSDTARPPVEPNMLIVSSTAPVQAPAADTGTTKRYCIAETTTGSHLRKKICRTRAHWLEQGFDPLAK